VLELYRQIGNLELGRQLKTISGITVFDDIKMEITFPNPGEARYQLYIQGEGTVRKTLSTVAAAKIVLKALSKLHPSGRRLLPAF
jgi:hypothetical protein